MIRKFGKIQVLGWLLAALVLVLAACTQPGATATLTVDVVGDGTVVSDPAGIDITSPGTTDAAFATDTEVTLTATAAAGSTFDSWGGACSGVTANTCTLTMDASKSVTATFTATATGPFTLTVNKDGTGTGTVASNPAGIDCGADCTEEFADGTLVTLTATADVESTFTGWTGCDAATGNECTVTMDSAQSVTATFAFAGPGTNVTYQVSASEDDAEEFLSDVNPTYPAGSVYITSSDLDMNYDTQFTSGTIVGLRFQGVDIPQGATINSASITFTRDAIGAGTVTYTIRGEDVDDAAPFEHVPSMGSQGISLRADTAASTTWTSDTAWDATATTPDMAGVVQEIVDRGGWFPGNAVVFTITADVMNADNYRRAVSYDENPLAAPVLNINYTAP